MAFIELHVEPHDDAWTVRHERALFERYPRARDALKRAQRQAGALRRQGHQARVRLHDAGGQSCGRAPKGRVPGELPPYEC